MEHRAGLEPASPGEISEFKLELAERSGDSLPDNASHLKVEL